MLKRFIACVLSAIITTSAVTSVKISDSAKSQTNASSESISQKDYDVHSTNSLGNYISNCIENNDNVKNSALSDSNEKKGYSISKLEFDNSTGKIQIITSQPVDCVATIEFNDEETGKTKTSVDINVKKGEMISSEGFADVSLISGYYMITAVLKDESGNAVTEQFTQNKYTKEMQEILAANVNDFDPKQVVNFDDRQDTNFIVLSKDTVKAESSSTENTLVSSDYDDNVYVFDNADESVKSLKKGEFFYIQPDNENIIAISVDSVKVDDNNQVTVTGNDDNIDDMFDFVKFESQSKDMLVDTSNSDDNLSFTDLEKNKPVQLFDTGKPLNFSYTADKASSFDVNLYRHIQFDFDKQSPDNRFGEGESDPVELKMIGSFTFNAELNFYKKFSYVNIDFALTNEVALNFECNASVDKSSIITDSSMCSFSLKVAKITLLTSIPGILINIEPTFKVELSAKISATISFSQMLGVSYDSKTKKIDKKSNPIEDCFNASFEIEGKLSFSLSLGPKVVLFDEKIAYIEIEASISLNTQISVSKDIQQRTFSTSKKVFISSEDEDFVHACSLCAKGTTNLELSADVKVSAFSHEITSDLFQTKSIPLDFLNYHISSETGFGLGECQNNDFKLKFVVNEIDNSKSISVEDAVITIDDLSSKTNKNGITYFYCANGNYNYTLTIGDKVIGSGTVNMDNSVKSIELTLNSSVDGNGNKVYSIASDNESIENIVTTTTVSKHIPAVFTKTTLIPPSKVKIIEAGAIGNDSDNGKNIVYTLHSDGYLLIKGHGEMKDFSDSPINKPELIKQVVIEDDENGSITNIGARLFYGAKNLETVYLSNEINKIGYYAFYGCNNLKYLRYGDENDTTKAFVLPQKLKNIDNNAFYGCTNAQFNELNIPNTVTSIGDNAFANCNGLTAVTVPGTVKSIGTYAFSGCKNLKTAIIKDGVENIGAQTFSDCTALTSLTLPYAGLSLKSVDDNSAPIYSNLFNYSVPTETYNAGGHGIPNTLTNITITGGTKVPDYAFYGMSSLKNVTLPNSITSIGNYAFSGCTSINNNILPSKIINIGDSAFNGCGMTQFNELNIPNTVTSIGDNAFANCNGLTAVTVPGTVKSIGTYAFSGCKNLKTAIIKDGVENIGAQTFSDCTALTSLTLPYAGLSLKSVDDNSAPIYSNLFNYSVPTETYNAGGHGIPNTLTNITITGGTKVPDYAFYGMSSLKNVTLPNSITSIGNYAFSGCTSINNNILPSKIINIGDSAFNGCGMTQFNELNIPNTVTSIGDNAFANCNGLTAVTVPGTVKSIGTYAFSGCKNLKTAIIKDGVENIGAQTFSDCTALTSLTLPYAGLSLKSVDDNSA